MRKPLTPMNPQPRPPAQPDEQPSLTSQQEAKRRRWAETLCMSAQNETSLTLAKKLCKRWFNTCECVNRNLRQESLK
jgi:hypothetical protein